MCRYFLLLSFLFSSGLLMSQQSEKQNVNYKSKTYDIISFKVDSTFASQIAIINNSGLIAEKDLYDSLEQGGKYFAINAGSVDSLCNLLGLELSEGILKRPMNLNSGAGNFYSYGNAVFAANASGVAIMNTKKYDSTVSYNFALQAGPLLVEDKKINKEFSASSKNQFLRCGIGIRSDNNSQIVYFVIANVPVSFYQFADLFLNKLKCQQAINLESAFYASAHFPNLKRTYSTTRQICNFIYIKL